MVEPKKFESLFELLSLAPLTRILQFMYIFIYRCLSTHICGKIINFAYSSFQSFPSFPDYFRVCVCFFFLFATPSSGRQEICYVFHQRNDKSSLYVF